MKNHNNIVSIVAISGIVLLESIALLKGINGVLFGTAMSIIGGIAGYTIKNSMDKYS